MRNLTIKRRKSFVGCLAKMKVYIEDADSPEININGKPCRKLGTLKNGEEKTFSVSENEGAVFVIADALSKEYCNDFYTLPAGNEDISLCGQNKFNPAAGNAFRFDGVSDDAVLQNRKKGNKKGIIIICISAIVGAIVGVFIGSGGFSLLLDKRPAVFTYENMSIVLDNSFESSDSNEYIGIENREVAVFLTKEDFSLFADGSDYSLEEYADLVLKANANHSPSELKDDNGLTYFEYSFENTDNNLTYIYYSYLYKSNDSFWIIQFVTDSDNIDEYRGKFSEWAKTVSFSDNI